MKYFQESDMSYFPYFPFIQCKCSDYGCRASTSRLLLFFYHYDLYSNSTAEVCCNIILLRTKEKMRTSLKVEIISFQSHQAWKMYRQFHKVTYPPLFPCRKSEAEKKSNMSIKAAFGATHPLHRFLAARYEGNEYLNPCQI